ncbi:ABC transporter ATP-binding protein [Chitinophaga agrisoli]|uniref:ABC transporter ATP-binding protein n=1 Tax=Chitinophaga agrisoli TaxID=2607653 RepID=A0A5B2VRR7_9BACT|nr:ABC transporter ATP-binding protein [Chitinophaga agrisoli]KAA2241705.1 ABC transporter ATP-binding protein [Chitinophaga agrisoli]
MNYNLNSPAHTAQKTSTLAALKKLFRFLEAEQRTLILAFLTIMVSSGLNLTGPVIIGYTIDHFIQHHDYQHTLLFCGLLLLVYMTAFGANYLQARIMGGIGQRMLFTLRNAVFGKLQELPVAFFNQNKTGDLISRINNDTDKVNQFFSQYLLQFVSNIFLMVGAGIFLVSIHPSLGGAALVPAAFLLIFTRLISPWVRRKNAANMKSTGSMSAEVQESLNNFKVIIAFNRRDYFRKRFDQVNKENYATAVGAGMATNLFMPVFGVCAQLAQLIVLTYGIYQVANGNFTVGLLISYLAYVNSFYTPIRQISILWANFQVALAGWDRISQILTLQSDLPVLAGASANGHSHTDTVMEFKDVHFSYPDSKPVLHNVSFQLQRGKTYALVGPTGGGKTTTASLIARLYDPTEGEVMLNGKDIRIYEPAERSGRIGFILQEPFLFTGTIRDNILFGNEQYAAYSNEQLAAVIQEAQLESLLARFEGGLDTKVLTTGDSVSLGQKQLIAFIRAVLRRPDLLILDEATANIDTITEQLLEKILQQLPDTTTRVIIAHRLNTIENADEIFFVNGGEVTRAGSLDHAVNMLLHEKRES